MTTQEEGKDKPKQEQNEKLLEQKKDEEQKRKQIEENNKKFDNKLMKYFGNEFFERRLEIPPKRSPFDPLELDEDLDKIIPKNKILRKLIHFEKKIDEKIFKTRLDIQEQILRPKNMIKAILRMHIFAYSKDDENSDETNFFMNIQGKIMNNGKTDSKYRKFSHYFQKIQIKFDEEVYPDIEWESPKYKKINPINNINNNMNNNFPQQQNNMNINNLNNNVNQNNQTNANNSGNNINTINDFNMNNREKDTDCDGFYIKRPAKEENMKVKILFYLSYHIQEFVLTKKLSELLGITQGTRPEILYHLWQYIK
jgi:chromatin remodeling complex protein RSC6